MDVEICASLASNGEVATACIKDGPSKEADDSAESKVCDDTGCSDEASQNSGITNGCPDTSAVAEDDTAGPVNGTSDEGAAEVGLVDKPSSDTDAISTVEDGSKGNSEALECGDSQQDSIVDDDAEKTEASEPSEDLPLPDAKGSDSVKNKETNSEDSTPSTPRRTMKKKSKKVSKLSIMHAIAERLSGQSKGDSKGASRAESKGDGESNASDSTSEVTEERLTHDSKDSSEADPKPASPARESGSSKKSGNTCAVCSAVKGLRYQVLYQGRTQFLCSDVCFKAFRSKQKLAPKKPPERDRCAVCQKEHADSTGFYSSFGPCKTLCSADCLEKHQKSQRPKRTCVQCKQSVEAADLKGTLFLVWETMEFCAEECLRKYQSTHGSHCSHCRTAVSQLSLGKYCVRFGADIRQFCSGKCLEEFKRGLKVCCLCQKDLSKQTEGFLAPVGDKGHFKDFCSQQCLDRYERMNAFNAANLVAHKCAACEAETTTKYQVEFNEGSHRLCSDACVSKFRYANKIKTVVCENCHKLFDNTACPPHSLYYDNACQQFCTKACVNLFVLSHRKIVPCSWCKVKKYNFDMIEQVEINSPSHLFCSINCLNLFRVNHNATSSRVIRCDNCTKMMPAQYHLTMSDATIRNFCSYKCVITFQNQFKNLPLLTTTSPTVTQATMGKSQVAAGTSSNTPVISNIRSLAPLVKPGGQPVIPTSMQSASEMKSVSVPSSLRPPPTLTAMPKVVSAPVLTQANSVTDVAPKVVAQAPSIAASASAPAVTVTVPPPATLKPSVLKDIASVAPTPGQAEREVIIQLPFPKLLRNKSVLCRPTMVSKAAFCRPMGCHKEMQTEAEAQTGSESGPVRLIPVPVPIYVPVPMHMFSHAVPSPMPIPIPVPVPIFLPTTRDTTEQILETLKEIKEQMKDDKFDEVLLTIARSLVEASSSKTSPPEQTADDPPETRPRKRAASEEADDDISSKKTKVSDDEMETSACSVATEDTVVRTHESLDPAAAASSWQDWVQKKNSELEKGSLSGKRQLKLFKTNLLSMTPEELNYALCLFVKEVRQPDNTPPSPCHIYLQCLGIQQYLHEQGRQDNIFADPQYEMFTGCFHSIFSQASSPDRELREHVREEVLWRAKQLGDHSPLVLLNTLMYFNVKYFRLHTVEQHLQLSLADVTEQEEEGPEGQSFKILRSTVGRQEKESDHGCCDQPENVENPQRCPVKLYELYLSKCPEAARSKQGAYYMLPDRACSVESSVWYSCNPLGKDVISRMLTRFSVVEEVKELSSKLFAQA